MENEIDRISTSFAIGLTRVCKLIREEVQPHFCRGLTIYTSTYHKLRNFKSIHSIWLCQVQNIIISLECRDLDGGAYQANDSDLLSIELLEYLPALEHVEVWRGDSALPWVPDNVGSQEDLDNMSVDVCYAEILDYFADFTKIQLITERDRISRQLS